jgi:hypothetical protein
VVTPDYMCNKVLGICKNITYREVDDYEAAKRIIDTKEFENEFINK